MTAKAAGKKRTRRANKGFRKVKNFKPDRDRRLFDKERAKFIIRID